MTAIPSATPPLSAPQKNKVGFIGFIISIVGILTCGFLCPLGALLSFIGVFKKPKGYAIAGLIIGSIGTIIPVILVLIYGWAFFTFISCVNAGANFIPQMQAAGACEMGVRSVQSYVIKNGHLPDDATGNSAIYFPEDIWFKRVRYKALPDGDFEVRSAGPDHAFDTPDDIVRLGSEMPPTTETAPAPASAPATVP